MVVEIHQQDLLYQDYMTERQVSGGRDTPTGLTVPGLHDRETGEWWSRQDLLYQDYMTGRQVSGGRDTSTGLTVPGLHDRETGEWWSRYTNRTYCTRTT